MSSIVRSIDAVEYIVLSRVACWCRRDDEPDRAVGINMVWTVLSVILDDEDRSVFPEPRVANGVHELAHGVVVVSDHRPGREGARSHAICVVFGKRHDHKRGPLAGRFRVAHLPQEILHFFGVATVPSKDLLERSAVAKFLRILLDLFRLQRVVVLLDVDIFAVDSRPKVLFRAALHK